MEVFCTSTCVPLYTGHPMLTHQGGWDSGQKGMVGGVAISGLLTAATEGCKVELAL